MESFVLSQSFEYCSVFVRIRLQERTLQEMGAQMVLASNFNVAASTSPVSSDTLRVSLKTEKQTRGCWGKQLLHRTLARHFGRFGDCPNQKGTSVRVAVSIAIRHS